MHIRLKMSIATNTGVYSAGEVIDHPDGKKLVAAGVAESVKATAEDAVRKPSENAAKRKRGKRNGVRDS